MTDDRDASRLSDDDKRINSDDDAEVARWVLALFTSPEELREAIRAVGPEVGKVKRYLFTVLLRRHKRGPDSNKPVA
jgi:hypothetical protein